MTRFHATIRLVPLVVLLSLGACGGGGGSSPDSGTGGPPVVDDTVTFLGFAFRSGTGEVVGTPPFEDLTATPAQLGAALNTVVVFRFSGVPEGPFGPGSLPVFTTPAEVTALVTPFGDTITLPAKGSYVRVGDTVEFHPFLPTAPLAIDLAADPASIPGLLPDSVYTARVATGPTALANLAGGGASTQFGTTSLAAGFFPSDPTDDDAPRVVDTQPADGSVDFFPGVFSPEASDGSGLLFPPGPSSILLTYDRALEPSAANLHGSDLDGDGSTDGSFFLRARATRLLVAHELPAGALGGAHPAFPALSAYEPGDIVTPAGDHVVIHGGSVLPDPQSALTSTPSALASDREAAMVWAVLPVVDGPDRLALIDHSLGDPSHALLSEGSVETGLDDIAALTCTLDGRLLAYDRATRRIHELLPAVVRQLPGPGAPALSPPLLVSLGLGDGVDGFASAPLSDPGLPADPDVLDLAMGPDGELLALARLAGSTLTSLVRLQPVDPDLDGEFEDGEGTFSGDTADVLFTTSVALVDVEVERAGQILGLDAASDRLVRLDLTSGVLTSLVENVGALGADPGVAPAARALAIGFVDFDVEITVLANTSSGAVVRLEPRALLPPGVELDVMQRHRLASPSGVSLANEHPEAPLAPLGSIRLLTVTTAQPSAGPGAPIDDAFVESFDDQAFEATEPTSTFPAAEWAQPDANGQGSGGLQASVGVTTTDVLGDFLPVPGTDFNPEHAWGPSGNPPEPDLSTSAPGFRTVFLNTDAQVFPLPDGSTPGVTSAVTVLGGRFAFRDIVIPESVRLVARGTRPLVLTATGDVEIHGLIDLTGTNGFSDDTFDSGFLPVPGGPGGPSGGRGGDGHPTLFDPSGPGALDQYVTPERGERGLGPQPGPAGVTFASIGGHGGLSTLGYDPNPAQLPKVSNTDNNEHHRPPGGGGGSGFGRGDRSYEGAGVYLVQSDSTWFPFSQCETDAQILDSLYGNEEHRFCGGNPSQPLQCVYMVGSPEQPERLKPGAEPGDMLFADDDRDNDYIGPGGEVEVLVGGQGGGGGGSRIDSMRHLLWAPTASGDYPPGVPPVPPCYPKLFAGVFLSPTRYDAKGAGAGGGGGALQIRSFGDIIVGRTGHIDASGGHGGGSEVTSNSNFAGGGGGGSGGAILLQAAGALHLQADASHTLAGYVGTQGDHGASLDVSGGFGRDARADPTVLVSLLKFTYEASRSDGGQGGSGLVQLQSGGTAGAPQVDPGAYAFARKRTQLKLGKWTGDPQGQSEHPSWVDVPVENLPPADLRYIEMLHWRTHRAEGEDSTRERYYVLNGSHPPSLPSPTGLNGMGPVHEHPPGSGQLWADTKMLEHPVGSGRFVVQDPQPERIFRTSNGYTETFDPDTGVLLSVKDINFPQSHPEFPGLPGETYAGEDIPLSIELLRPSGMAPLVSVDGQTQFAPDNLVDRLPMVPFGLAPPAFGSVSQGTSRWLDFAGMALRPRDGAGGLAPFFAAFHGTYNDALGTVPPGKDGRVATGAAVPGKPAHFVQNAGPAPFDPGLYGQGAPPDPAFNDIAVHAPDLNEQNAISSNATVTVLFQAARPLRTGSHVPDPQSLTPWTSDLSALSGFPLVRFRVTFDLDADPQNAPFGPDSLRPFVDQVRLRATY